MAYCQHKGFDISGYSYRLHERHLATLRESLGEDAFQLVYEKGYDCDPVRAIQEWNVQKSLSA